MKFKLTLFNLALLCFLSVGWGLNNISAQTLDPCTGNVPIENLANGMDYTIVSDGAGNVDIMLTVVDNPDGLVGFLGGPGGEFQVAGPGGTFSYSLMGQNDPYVLDMFFNWAAGGAGNSQTVTASCAAPAPCTGNVPIENLANGMDYTIVTDGAGNVDIMLTVVDNPDGLVGFLGGPGGEFQIAGPGGTFSYSVTGQADPYVLDMFFNWAAGGAGNSETVTCGAPEPCVGNTPIENLANGMDYTIASDGNGNVDIMLTVVDNPDGLVGFLGGPGGEFQIAGPGGTFSYSLTGQAEPYVLDMFFNWAAGGAGNSETVTCPEAPQPVDVEFCVDVSCLDPADINTVGIFGSFNDFNPGEITSTDPDGDGIFCTTLSLMAGDYEYKFILNGGMGAAEEAEEFEEGAPCTVSNFGFTNRIITVEDGGPQMVTFGWNACDETCVVPLDDPDLPITFEGADTIDYALADFGGNVSVLGPDPVDPDNTVVCVTKTTGAADFAGTVIADNGLANPIPFTMNATTIAVRVFSPEAGIPILLKVEDAANAGIFAEVLNTTVTMDWETLVFDFGTSTNQPLDLNNTYDKIVIFFDFGSIGEGQNFCFDDIEFCADPVVVTCPPNVTIDCDASTDPPSEAVGGVATATDTQADLSWGGPSTGVIGELTAEVTGIPATASVTNVNVVLQADHSFLGDLELTLVSPDGTSFLFLADECGSETNIDATFSDAGAAFACGGVNINSVPEDCSNDYLTNVSLSGALQSPEGSFAQFNGETAAGVWTLEVLDDAGGDGGCFNTFGVEVTWQQVAADGNPDLGVAVGTYCVDPAITFEDETTQAAEATDAGFYNYTITRSWIATAPNGLADTCMQIITVQDTTAPDLSVANGLSVTLDDNGVATIDSADIVLAASDNCSAVAVTFDPTLVDGALAFNCENIGVNTITVTATDVSGNTTVETTEVEVVFIEPELGCINEINVTLNENCQALLIPEMVLAGNTVCLSEFTFDIVVEDDDPTNGPIIDGCGQFVYTIESLDSIDGTTNGFEGDFSEANWTVDTEIDGDPGNTATVDFTATTLVLNTTSNNGGGGTTANTPFAEASYMFSSTGEVSFDYDYDTDDAGFDVFIIDFEGNMTPVDISGDSDQSGSVDPYPVNPGDMIMFRVFETDGIFSGINQLTISDFEFVGTIAGMPLENFLGCWGFVNAEDKLSPRIQDSIEAPAELFCVDLPEVNLNELPANVSRCFQVDAAGNVPANFYNTALGSRLAAGSANGVIPTFFDGCSAMEICVNDLVPVTDLCDDVVITRVFTATDGIDCESVSGEENEPTVFSYEIIFTRPDVDEVMSEAGGAEFDCDEPLTLLPVNGFGDANPEPAFDDFPFITRADGSRVYLDDEGFCNLGATFEDGPRIVTCPQTYKFVRTWTVIDWCDVNNIETFTQLVKVGDFDAPMITAPTQDLDFNGVPDVGPLFYSANTSDCEAVFIIPAGSAMDACDPNPGVSVVVYPFQDTTALAFGPFAVGSPTLGGIPRGLHTLRYVATDACGNSSTLDVDLLIGDETAPVAICEDGLNLSIGGPIGPQGGMAQICAEDVDRASYDACSDIRRDIRITQVNGINVSPFSPLFAFEECKTLTCAQLGTIEVELRVTDDGNEDGIFDPQVDNVNSCWLNILVEDKTAPVCIAPAPQTVTCADLAQNFPQDLNVAFALDPVGTAALLDAQFGAATGLDNCPDPVVTQSVVDNRNSCGVGLITRTFVVTDGEGFMAPPGCTQTINVIGIHDYTVVFPGDQESDQCVEPDYNGVNFETFGCDLITVSTSVDTFTATAEECYKLRITYEVLNWCEYNTIDPAYEIPRDADGDGILDMDTTVLHVVPNADGLADDLAFLDRDVNRNNFNTIGNLDTGDGGILDGSDVGGYGVDGSRGAFTYEQFIKVYDDTPPTLVIPTPEDICSFDGVDCDADVELTWSIDDECSPLSVNSTVELDAFIDGGLDGIYTLAEFINDQDVTDAVTNNGDGTFTINLPNIPIGRHALRIRATDGCGNTAIDLLIFEVIDCKAPTPICINGLTVTLMPDGDGGGMAAIWVSDFIASPVTDCNGPVKYAIYIDGEEPAVPNPLDTGLVLTCDELGPQTIRIYAIDATGLNDYCLTSLLVQAFNPTVCNNGPGSSLSGAVMTPIDEMMNDVEVNITSAGMNTMSLTTGGLYSFADLAAGDDYTLEPTHNPSIDLGRVTTADLIAISRHILGLQTITDTYQLLAADVTQEQSINILDIIAIRRVILGLDTEFNSTNSWRFYATSELLENWTENNLDGNVIAPDFVAVEMGNVNQTAMSLSGGESEGRGSENIVTEDIFLLPNVESTITVATNGGGFQGTFQVAPGVEIVDVVAADANATAFNLTQAASGLIAFSHTGGEGFELTLRATADVKLSEVLSLTDRITPTEAYPLEGGVADLGLSFVTAATAGSELFQNSPNPFATETQITFSLATAGTATLLVQNQNGQLLRSYEIDAAAGRNVQTITRQELGNVSGVLTYTIISEGFTATRKMILQ